jgi:hypothetical protein
VDAIGDLSLTADEIEDTVYGTGGWKTFVQGLKDAGTFDLTVNYGKDTSGNTRLTQAFVSGNSGAVHDHVPGLLDAHLHGVCVRDRDRCPQGRKSPENLHHADRRQDTARVQ